MAEFNSKKEVEVQSEPVVRELFAEIVQIISKIHPKSYPKQLPSNSHEAGNKFIGLIDFRQGWTEKPRMNQGGNVWVWPFRVRVLMLLDKYINADDLLRDTIDSAVLIGIDWRGDEFNNLVDLIGEHEIMNKIGVKEYRKETIKKMKAMELRK